MPGRVEIPKIRPRPLNISRLPPINTSISKIGNNDLSTTTTKSLVKPLLEKRKHVRSRSKNKTQDMATLEGLLLKNKFSSSKRSDFNPMTTSSQYQPEEFEPFSQYSSIPRSPRA